MQSLNIDIEVNEDYDEEAEIDNEIQRLKDNLSMDLEASDKGNVSCRSAGVEDTAGNFLIGSDARYGGKKKLRDKMMLRAYLPDDGQLQYF